MTAFTVVYSVFLSWTPECSASELHSWIRGQNVCLICWWLMNTWNELCYTLWN